LTEPFRPFSYGDPRRASTSVRCAFHLFVLTYEEPTLTRLFGEDYDDYRHDVGRWIPHRRHRARRRRRERA